MTYTQAIEEINSLLRFGMQPGLERISKLLNLMGNPHKRLKFVHVAGTNGKGSTCAITASVLSCAGYCTGRFISPYVLEFRERMQVNGQMIPERDLARITDKILPLVRQMAEQDEIITEFEFITAVAMEWFCERRCDLVVLEVGLGGRYDATNVIDPPLAAAITKIALDHMAILGNTLEKIAFEKCGILKQGSDVAVYPEQSPGVLEVIQSQAARRGCRVHVASLEALKVLSSGLEGTRFLYRGTELYLPLIGAHQIRNGAVALKLLEILEEKGFPVSQDALRAGLSQVRFPARMELLSSRPVFLLDGAHNPDGTKALAQALRQYLPGKKLVAVMGMLADKDTDTAVTNLSGLFHSIFTLTPANPRAMKAKDLALCWRDHGQEAIPMESVEDALFQAILAAGEEGAVVACGSLYLAEKVRPAALKILEKFNLNPKFD